MSKNHDIRIQEVNDDSTYDHVIKYTGLFGGVQGLTMLMNVVRNMVTSKLLGPAGLGFINIFNKTTGLLNQSTNLGISMSAVKHIATLNEQGDDSELCAFAHTVRSWTMLTAILGTLLCLVLAPLLSLWEFNDYSQLTSFILLAPVVGIMSLTSGEMAILKGMKQLKKVALISVFTATATLLLSLPLYLYWGIGSIATALLICSLAGLIIHLHYSTRIIPWSSSPFSRDILRKGMPMIWLGIAFILAGVFGEAAALFIQTMIKNYGGIDDVGLYNCSYTLAITSTSIAFVAMDADFFPRLAAAEHDVQRQNQTVNQQIEVCLILIVPCLIFFLTALPIIVPILYSNEFLSVIPMVVYSSIFMLAKAFDLPISYLALAKGDSRTYMVIELIFDVMIALLIPYAFRNWHLEGAGIALSFCGIVNLAIIYLAYRWKYKFRLHLIQVKTIVMQVLLYAAAFYISLHIDGWQRYVLGGLLLVLSAALSFRVVKQETAIVQRLRNKFSRKK